MDVDPPRPPHPSGTMTLPQGVVANAPYTQAPAPPMIVVPVGLGLLADDSLTMPLYDGHIPNGHHGQPKPQPRIGRPVAPTPHGEPGWLQSEIVAIKPSMLNAGFMGLSASQLAQFTGNRTQSVAGVIGNWSYEMRREAHAIVDFLYLGPSLVARDRAFLQSAGITMLLAARDSRMAQVRLLSVDRTAAELGIVARHVDVFEDRRMELIQALPGIVRSINEHMLGGPGRKVLIFCETGNDRSAAIVAAYLMTVYGLNLIRAMQFVSARRFCVNFDDETKQMLKAYGDILQAQRDVDGSAGPGQLMPSGVPADAAATPGSVSPGPDSGMVHVLSGRMKRRIEETMDEEDDRAEANSDQGTSGQLHLDMARYEDRQAFVPFRDVNSSGMN